MTTTAKKGLELLREPFAPNQISKLPKPYRSDSQKGNCQECGGYHGLPAMHLDFVGHAALTDRLLDADQNWTWEPLAFGEDGLPQLDRNGGMWIRLTVCGMTRLGYGDAQGKTGPNAVKELIGDALRNAAMRFGAALYLWHKGDLHADEDSAPAPAVQAVPDVPADESAMDPGQLRQVIGRWAKSKGVPVADIEQKFAEVIGTDVTIGSASAKVLVEFLGKLRTAEAA